MFFKPGASWLSAGATTSKNFMVGLNDSGSVKIRYNTSCSMILLSVYLSHEIVIKFTKCNFFFTFSSNKYSVIPKMKFLQAFSFSLAPVNFTPWSFSNATWFWKSVHSSLYNSIWKEISWSFDQVSWLFSLICWIPKYIGGSEISGQHWILVRASRYETHTKVWHWMEFVFLQAKYFTRQCFVVHNIQPRKLLSPPF